MLYLKSLKKKSNVLLIVIILLASLVRFYNFGNRATFWTEQARSLIVSAGYLQKPSLLGQEYFRFDTNGHVLFSGAIFNYSLVPLMLIFKYDPIPITAYFAFLNLATGLILYFLVQKVFNRKLAFLSLIIFIFNDLMIYHPLFIWNYNYLPLVGLLLFYFAYRKNAFWVGLIGGLGISIQFLFGPIAFVAAVYVLIKSKRKLKDILLILCGIFLGNMPMFIFDIRHDFYHMRTLYQYFVDTLAGRSDAALNYYYFLPFWPVFSLAFAWLVLKMIKYNKIIAAGILGIYIYLNLTSPRINFTMPTGMPPGIKISDMDAASKIVAQDASGNFNIAEVLDFDSRAYVFRYFLEYKYSKIPEDVESYPNAKTLYVMAPQGYNFGESQTWEVKSGWPYKTNKLAEVRGIYEVYKLTK